jgi:hypothetical protein
MEITKIIGTLIGCTLMLLVTLPSHGGFMFLFFLLFLVPSSLYSVIVMYRNKEERKLRTTKLSIGLIASLITVSFNYYRYINTRAKANNIVVAIEKYRSELGYYPKDLEAIGLSKIKLRNQLGMFGYFYNNGQPNFFYAVTYIIFDTYSYNFELKEWQYHSS